MDGISYEYTAHTPEASHSHLLPLVRSMLQNVPAGSTVVDLGCGNGSFLAEFRDFGWRLIGTDLSPSGISLAKSTYLDIDFFLADAQTDLGRQIGAADVVLSTEVIEHLYDPKAFFRNAYGLLKPGAVHREHSLPRVP